MIELSAASVHRSGMWQRLSDFIFGHPVGDRLPARVRDRIAAQQLQGEKLISWMQLLLVLLFGSLWAASPKGPQTQFDLVPAALAFYFAFTLVRMIAAYRNALNTPLLTASVVIDMALLMVLIWSFHIKYMQPASFYLKAPTLMYVFIFIGLRTLRFEPGYILLAGASASVGWLGLMYYVVHAEAGNPMITRDYVEYMTSNAILIGAEIDKIVSILMVTGVLAIAVLRARRSLYRAIIESTAAQDLSRFVSREVAERITQADHAIQPGDGESKVATIVFTDIEGFSTASEKMSPAELARTINDYFQAMGEIISRHGGVVLLFEGDAMLITFNAVTPQDDHAARAIDCALEIERVCRERTFGDGVRLLTRCGVNTGPIVVGAVGTAERLTFTVHGDNVNIAARLEQLNKQYGTYVMCTQETIDTCGGGYASAFQGEIPVKGRAAPVKVYSVAPVAD
ncbi:adenylate/guanylate cyclase domain-containing protein [Thalassospiraceae bacterium LMO-SO8]|nr:adenylate/guanylate cyclase domain-containing protein [Alphaproteobacteria bacterium LMO-S08]WND77782.1 adenylate/guanylate cyclase domain-containing protein [Thalassospiraceae bacterium LMO-SO8]